MKVLVTGGVGYIGSHTILELWREGHDVVVVDNLSNGKLVTLQRLEKITGKPIPFHKADITNKAELKEVINQHSDIEGVIHFAALKSVPESLQIPLSYYRSNTIGLINCIEVAIENNIKNFIFSSSCAVYGNPDTLPVNENTIFGSSESPYASTKQIGEQILRDVQSEELNIVALRYFNPAGADESGLLGEDAIHPASALVPVIIKTGLGKIKKLNIFGNDYDSKDGSAIRDFIHVSDLAQAHLKALDFAASTATNYEVFNIGTGTGVTILECVKAFEEVTGQALNYEFTERRQGDIAASYSDCKKSTEILGWKAHKTIQDIMKTAWEWENHLLNEAKSK